MSLLSYLIYSCKILQCLLCSEKILHRHTFHVLQFFHKSVNVYQAGSQSTYLKPHSVICYRANDNIVIMSLNPSPVFP